VSTVVSIWFSEEAWLDDGKVVVDPVSGSVELPDGASDEEIYEAADRALAIAERKSDLIAKDIEKRGWAGRFEPQERYSS
jgi:hypothetical protein